MNFSTAIKTCFSKYVDFNGRARRPEYWYFVLFLFIAQFVTSLLDQSLFGSASALPLTSLLSLVILLPNLAVTVRRLHDLDKSGWWVLICLIPLVGLVVLIYWFIQPGTSGPNRYGPEPHVR